MKKIINRLYADPKSDVSDFERRHLEAAEDRLTRRLAEELSSVYVWDAVAYAAVMAGRWGGDRRLARRHKLLAMINQIRRQLGWETVTLSEEVMGANLYYGFYAIPRYRAAGH